MTRLLLRPFAWTGILGIIFTTHVVSGAKGDLFPCTFSSSDLLNGIQDECADYMKSLETCPGDEVRPAERLEAASQTTNCIHYVLDKLQAIADNTTSDTKLEDLPAPIQIAGSKDGCNFPSFFELLESTCHHDLSTLDGPCPPVYNATLKGNIKHYAHFRPCSEQTTIQYVRCTIQNEQDPSSMPQCITSNAVKADWLNLLVSYTGASRCPGIVSLLVFLGIAVGTKAISPLVQFYSSLFLSHFTKKGRDNREKRVRAWHRANDMLNVAIAGMRMQEQQQQQQQQQKQQQQGYQYEYKQEPQVAIAGQILAPRQYDYQPVSEKEARRLHLQQSELASQAISNSPFRLATRYTLKATRFCQSIGSEVLTAFFISLALNSSHVFGESKFTESLLLYLIRPRAAPFTGLFGLFEPWSQQGIADLSVDLLLSFLAGGFVTTRYTGLIGWVPDTDNGIAPLGDLTRLSIGGILAASPIAIVFFILCCLPLGILCGSSGVGGALAIAFFLLTSVAMLVVFVLLLPVFALVEVSAAVVWAIKYKSGEKDYEYASPVRKSRWLEPLSFAGDRFRVFYCLLIVSSFCINIGNWMFWISYLRVAGELFCPTEISTTEAMLVLVPFGIDLVFYAFRIFTNDPSVGFHAIAGPEGGQEL